MYSPAKKYRSLTAMLWIHHGFQAQHRPPRAVRYTLRCPSCRTWDANIGGGLKHMAIELLFSRF